jgi:hypothetical protein
MCLKHFLRKDDKCQLYAEIYFENKSVFKNNINFSEYVTPTLPVKRSACMFAKHRTKTMLK